MRPSYGLSKEKELSDRVRCKPNASRTAALSQVFSSEVDPHLGMDLRLGHSSGWSTGY